MKLPSGVENTPEIKKRWKTCGSKFKSHTNYAELNMNSFLMLWTINRTDELRGFVQLYRNPKILIIVKRVLNGSTSRLSADATDR